MDSEAQRRFWERYERQLRVRKTLGMKVVIVILFSIENAVGDPDLTIQSIAEKVQKLVAAEGYEDVRITPKRVGVVVRDELGLETQRGTTTSSRRYEVVLDRERLEVLQRKFGLDQGVEFGQ